MLTQVFPSNDVHGGAEPFDDTDDFTMAIACDRIQLGALVHFTSARRTRGYGLVSRPLWRSTRH